ncbi:MAG TPA: KTSC domain-containing protein [Marinobacter sp.]|nr:KTSC domain-containing protein [Marinobacter sp.]
MNELLDIEFGSGGVYRYSDVPDSAFNGLLSASSKGGYFNEYIRDRFSYEKLE